MRFHARILTAGKTATGICVPDKIVEALGSSKRPAVRVTLNGFTYRSSVASMGGKFMVGVSAEVRKNAGVEGGDEVDVDIELDTEPRVVAVPRDLKDSLARDAKASRTFEALAYSHKLRHVLAIEAAKTPETRARRIDKTIIALREGQK